MIKFILSTGFKLAGWKVQGVKPDLSKYVIVVAPHTSNWDFFVGWGARNVIGFRPNFLAKDKGNPLDNSSGYSLSSFADSGRSNVSGSAKSMGAGCCSASAIEVPVEVCI